MTFADPEDLYEIDDEEQLQFWLKSRLKENDWRVTREAKVRNSLNRADIIAEHPQFGSLGIETKFFARDGGAKVADAHHQIVSKYRGQHYYTHGTVDLWAFCPCFKYMHREDLSDINGFYQKRGVKRQQFAREFFCRHGIGFISLDRKDLRADFNHSDRECKIPITAFHEYDHETDIAKIQDLVGRKMEDFDYGGSRSRTCQYAPSGGCTAPATESIEFCKAEIHVCEYHADAIAKEIAFP
jgi:hypothetical protein